MDSFKKDKGLIQCFYLHCLITDGNGHQLGKGEKK